LTNENSVYNSANSNSIETCFEDYLHTLSENHLINIQRLKLNYSNLELELKEKHIILKYYLEVISLFLKFLKYSPLKIIERNSNSQEFSILPFVKNLKFDEQGFQIFIESVKQTSDKLKKLHCNLKNKNYHGLAELNGFVLNSLILRKSYGSNKLINTCNLANSLFPSQDKNFFNGGKISSSNFYSQNLNMTDNFNSNPLIQPNDFSKNNFHNCNCNNHNSYMQISKPLDYDINQSLNLKSESRIPISTERGGYNKKYEPYDETNKFIQFIHPTFQDEKSSRCDKNFNIHHPLILDSSYLSKLSENDNNLVSIINEFILSEQDRLSNELLNYENHKNIIDNLNGTLEKIGNSQNIQNYSNSNYLLFSNYLQILEDDKEKLKLEARSFNYKKNIYDKIESAIEDCYIYIKNNVKFETKKDLITEKLTAIKNHIDDYYEVYSELKKINLGTLKQQSVTNKEYNVENFNKNTINFEELNSVKTFPVIFKNHKNNSLDKIGNSTNFFISQKLNDLKSDSNYSTYLPQSKNSNFISDKKSMIDDFFM
jgi:hypothetical protein